MGGKRVLSVGQCGLDHGNISQTLRRAFGAEVVGAHGAAEMLDLLQTGPFALVLVNRVFDADGSSGLELIRRLRAEPSLAEVPVMLVSNYQDAQQEAVAAGARPGFGKASLGRADMLARVEPYLGSPHGET
jgi:two-component system chemotaxis response regulator CheY